MKRFFVVSIDTEADCSKGWLMRYPFQTVGVTHGVKDILTPLFQKYGVRPTYLLAHEILRDDNAMEVLRNTPNCEMGTHLHWHDPERFPYHDRMHRYFVQGHFSYEEEFSQMKQLTELFREKTGYSPISFRAGRFGTGANTGKILTELGYKIDTSVTPHIKHSCPHAGEIADYTDAEEAPHHIREDGELRYSGNGSLLEVPVTIWMRRRYWDPASLPAKRPAWFRPWSMNKYEMMMRLLFPGKIKIINMMFHNVEVVPGLSAYAQNEKQIKKYLDDMSAVLHLASSLGYEFVTLSELLPRLNEIL